MYTILGDRRATNLGLAESMCAHCVGEVCGCVRESQCDLGKVPGSRICCRWSHTVVYMFNSDSSNLACVA